MSLEKPLNNEQFNDLLSAVFQEFLASKIQFRTGENQPFKTLTPRDKTLLYATLKIILNKTNMLQSVSNRVFKAQKRLDNIE